MSNRNSLFTPQTRKHISLARRLEEQAAQASEPDEYFSLFDVYRSRKFLNGLCTSVIITVSLNVLFTWGTLSSWGSHAPSKTYAFYMFQPAGGKGPYTCAAIDIAITTFVVAVMTTLGTFEKTDEVDIGNIGAVDQKLLSKGIWRYIPRGPDNCRRLTLNAILWPIIFGGTALTVMLALWVLGIGGYGMQMTAWGYITPKSLWLGVEASMVYTTTYVVALSNGDRSRREATELLVQKKIAKGTKCLNITQIIAAFVVVGFASYTWFFAYGGVQVGTVIGMWTSGGAGMLLGMWGMHLANYDVSRAKQIHLFYFIFQCCFVVETIVAAGFCLVYSDQGRAIVDNNWNKIKTAILLPFTSEYDLKQTLSFNLDFLAGLGFFLAVVMLFGIAHFTKRMGPGQNIILSMQSMNMVLMVLGVVTVWLIGDVGQITAFTAPDGSFVFVVMLILECGMIFVTSTVGLAAVGKRHPRLLVYYMCCLFALLIPILTFASLCFVRAGSAHDWVFKNWDIIQQVLPPSAAFWSNCSPQDTTKCTTGLAVTGKANFEAIGWMAVTTTAISLLQIWITFRVRLWQLSVEHFGGQTRMSSVKRRGTSLSYEDSMDNLLASPQNHEYLPGSSRENSTEKDSMRKSLVPQLAYNYGTLYDEERAEGGPDDASGSERWLMYASERMQGVSCAGIMGSFAPSNILMNLHAWSIVNPLVSKLAGAMFVLTVSGAVFIGALFLRASTVCGVIARSPQSTTHTLSLPVPYGCYNGGSGKMEPLGPNGTCAGFTTKYPNIFKIKIEHSFPYGYVNIVSKNATAEQNDIVASLVYSSVEEGLTKRFENSISMSTYSFETGTLHLKINPPDYAVETYFGGYTHCPAAALTLVLPTPLYIPFGVADLTLLEVCADTKDAGPSKLNKRPLGCTDLEITTSDSQVMMASGIDISLSELSGNKTNLFIQDLVSQYPFRDLTVHSSGSGNVLGNSIFAMGKIDLQSEHGYVTLTNSFGDGVSVKTTSKPIDVLDLGGVGLDLTNPDKPSFAYASIGLQSDAADIFFGNLIACDAITISTKTGDTVGATVQILGNMKIHNDDGIVYLNGVSSLADIDVTTSTGSIKGSAVVANQFTATTSSGSVSIIEMFLGIAVKSLAPPNQGTPKVDIRSDSGDITVEGMQGLANPADAGSLNVNLITKAAGNVKVIVNGNGFLGQYRMNSLHGVQGVLIEGEEMPGGLWTTRGCVPVPKSVSPDSAPPATCPHRGLINIGTLYGNAELVQEAGAR
jgi:hypothetical protein